MTRRFNKVLEDMDALSETCIFLLRVEVRCHSMYYLDLAMREGNYHLEDESFEPDPYIGLLNQDLTNMEEMLTSMLPETKIRFLFDGLAFLIANVLCANLRHIKRVNQHGVQKLIRNVLSLQQNLTNIAAVHDKRLDRAKTYYELLSLDAEGLLRFMEQSPGRFTYDEFKVVLDLAFVDALAGETTAAERKRYETYLQRIKDWFVKHR
ncbi:Exocyst complex component 4 [Rhizophlyctis rosea]|nr:Exocyst complex component 4 [Rhizophlyctis rosea]